MDIKDVKEIVKKLSQNSFIREIIKTEGDLDEAIEMEIGIDDREAIAKIKEELLKVIWEDEEKSATGDTNSNDMEDRERVRQFFKWLMEYLTDDEIEKFAQDPHEYITNLLEEDEEVAERYRRLIGDLPLSVVIDTDEAWEEVEEQLSRILSERLDEEVSRIEKELNASIYIDDWESSAVYWDYSLTYYISVFFNDCERVFWQGRLETAVGETDIYSIGTVFVRVGSEWVEAKDEVDIWEMED